jgi:Cu(I)/Ag(I) efflux system membrane fusion protein
MNRGMLCSSVMMLSVGLYGCGSTSPSETPSSPSGATNAHEAHADHAHGEHSEHAHGDDGQSDMEKMKAELAKLPPEDKASAEKQHVCPVSGEMLGTMGAPKKIDVNGQQVWICCNACKDKLLANPDEYFAKLKKE